MTGEVFGVSEGVTVESRRGHDALAWNDCRLCKDN